METVGGAVSLIGVESFSRQEGLELKLCGLAPRKEVDNAYARQDRGAPRDLRYLVLGLAETPRNPPHAAIDEEIYHLTISPWYTHFTSCETPERIRSTYHDV